MSCLPRKVHCAHPGPLSRGFSSSASQKSSYPPLQTGMGASAAHPDAVLTSGPWVAFLASPGRG